MHLSLRLTLASLFVLQVGFASANPWDYEVPRPRNIDHAEFRLWLPENLEQVRGVLVLAPGYNSNGLRLADRPQWQEFAREHDLALVGCYFESTSDRHYAMVSNGSGGALLDALTHFAQETGHEELDDLPPTRRSRCQASLLKY